MFNFVTKSILSITLVASFGCSKKSDSGSVDTTDATVEPESTTAEIDGGIGASVPGGTLPTEIQILPPAPFEAQIQSDLGIVKVGALLSCAGTTTAGEGEVLTYSASWFQSLNSLDGWAPYEGALDVTGQQVLVGIDSAHKFLKCRLQAQSSSGLSTTANSVSIQVADSPTNILPLSLMTIEDQALSITLSLGNGYTDEDLDQAASIQNVNVVGGTLDSWVCSNGSCTSIFTPTPNFFGAANFDFNIVSTFESASFSGHANINVAPVNDAPILMSVANQVTDEDVAIDNLIISVMDIDQTINCSAAIAVTSSNATLLPASNVSISGTSPNCYLSILPSLNNSGTATIGLTVSDDEGASATTSFSVVVNPVNDSPAIANISNKTTDEDVPMLNIPVLITDIDSSLNCNTSLTGTSGNTTLLSNSSIIVSGSSPNCLVSLSPSANQNGASTVNLTVNDGSASASTQFTFTVNSINDLPVIGNVSDQNTNEDSPVSGLAISISDVDHTLTCSGSLSSTSSNTLLIDPSNVVFSGVAPNCIATITPNSNLHGSSSINISVTDGAGDVASTAFLMTVSSVNDGPTIANIENQSTLENQPLLGVSIVVGDVDDSLVCSSALVVTSDNQSLISNSNIVIGGSAPNCTVDISPSINANGNAALTVVVSDSGGLSASDSFTVSVGSVNNPPSISDIANQSTDEDVALSTVAFSVSDIDDALDCQTSVVVSSSNSALVPSSNIILSGAAPNCAMQISPSLNLSGLTTIVVTVTDASGLSSNDSFSLTVNTVNDAPTISTVAAQTTSEDIPVTGVAFEIHDVDSTLACDQSIVASSSNTSLLSNSNITISGSAPNCILSATPNLDQIGSSLVTLTLTDDLGASVVRSFNFTVDGVNDAPSILAILDQVSNEDTNAQINLQVSDPDGALTCSNSNLMYTSSNSSLVPNTSAVVWGGSWPNCTATISPVANANGSTNISVIVLDGTLSDSKTFSLTVTPVNDSPIISDITNKTINEDSSLTAVTLSITDVDSSLACQTSLTAVSSNQSLLLDSQISFSGTAPNCQLEANPEANANGVTSITVSVTDDGSLVASDSFQLTVISINDVPSDPSGVAVSGASGIAVGKTVECLGSSIDLDGETLTYTRSFDVGLTSTGPWAPASGSLNGLGQLLIHIDDAHKYIRCTLGVSDGNGGTSAGTSSAVEIGDTAPVAVALSDTFNEDSSILLNISPGEMLGYVDADGDFASSIVVDNLSSGVIDDAFVCDGSGVCTATYVPQPNYHGSASFIFSVVNDFGSSVPVQYSLNVTPVNDPPVFVDSPNTPIEKDVAFELNLNASDVDSGDQLTVSCITNCPSGISFTGSVLNWTPSESHLGNWVIGIRVTDLGGLTDEGTVDLTVLDTTPPETPTIASVVAVEPVGSRVFRITGTANGNSVVSIFKNASCSSSPIIQVPSETFNTAGSEVALTAAEIYVPFSAKSVDSSGNVSSCSSTYQLMRGATKIRDFMGAEGSSAPDRAVEYQGKYYFAADDLSRGRELWVYDPALETSTLVADLELSGSSSPTNLVSIGSYLYFSAFTVAHGREIWRTDGTSSETIRLSDFCTGVCSSNPSTPVALNGKAYFTATTTSYGSELLVSDGTVGGTTLVKDIRSGTTGSTPLYLTVINDIIWMQAADATTGTEVWLSDGTTGGTVRLKDIFASGNSAPQGFTAVTGGVVFQAATAAAGAELWFSDGTSAGTQLVSDIQAGTTGSAPSGFLAYAGKAYFAATTTASGKELWTTDGTPAGTFQVKEINAGTASSNPASLTLGLGKFFFQATTSTSGAEVWVSDGTAVGTTLLKDIRSGTSSSSPTNFTASANRVYFSADTSSNRELWVSDGTTSGTIQYDIYPGASGFTGSTYWITATEFGALFQGTNATNGTELYKFTESGATAQLASNIAGVGTLVPKNMVTMNGQAYFVADDGVNGSELWAYDGTSATLVKDICSGSCSSLITSLYSDGSKLYFSAYTAALGNEPWVSDGTSAGTFNLANFGTTTASSSPSGFVKMGSDVYFVATSSANGRELYKTDGTSVGTVLVKDIRSGTSSSSPSNPVVVSGNTLFFQATDGTTGVELWKSDGTAIGTILVSDFIAGSTGLTPTSITALGSSVVFSGTTSANGAELFASDGTTVSLVSDIRSGTSSSTPTGFALYGGKAYFRATGASGLELYATDGTSGGTALVKDIYAGTNGSTPSNIVATSSGIYFTATTASQGTELWKSDGTAAGTIMVSDIFTGSSSSSPSSLVAIGDNVYFTANNGINGFDLFQVYQSSVVRVFDNVFQSVSIPSFAAPGEAICFFGSTGTDAGSPSLLCW